MHEFGYCKAEAQTKQKLFSANPPLGGTVIVSRQRNGEESIFKPCITPAPIQLLLGVESTVADSDITYPIALYPFCLFSYIRISTGTFEST